MGKFPDCPDELRDTVIEWCFCYYPILLSDDELVEGLIYFTFCVYQGAINEERRCRWQQLTKSCLQ